MKNWEYLPTMVLAVWFWFYHACIFPLFPFWVSYAELIIRVEVVLYVCCCIIVISVHLPTSSDACNVAFYICLGDFHVK